MKKKREYKGCELSSPLYIEVAREMALDRASKQKKEFKEYKTKKGKRSND
ncbi:MAG: hypothetical protein ACKVK4_08045 [Flavobacteriales bacterium]|tara:strand:- start:1127 stop:1276 length:150 start_codon:yes stop_codon:yes gene_type:complete